MRHKLIATLAAVLMLALHPPIARAEVPLDMWDGQRAMGRIADLLRFTPRAIDTPGHQQAIDYIKAEMDLPYPANRTIRLRPRALTAQGVAATIVAAA